MVCLALLGLAALPAYPWTETTSVKLRLAEAENARMLLGESPAGQRAEPARRASVQHGAGGAETMTLSIPKLGLENVPVPTADSQVELDREGIIHPPKRNAREAWPKR